MSKRLDSRREASSEDGDDEEEDASIFKIGTEVVMNGLPPGNPSYENAVGTITLIDAKTAHLGQSAKVMVNVTSPIGLANIRLAVRFLTLHQRSTLSRIGIALSATFDAALQLLKPARVQVPVLASVNSSESFESSDDQETESVPSTRFRFKVIKCHPEAVPEPDSDIESSSQALSAFQNQMATYMKQLTEWRVVLLYDGIVATNSTIFGPYEIVDMKNQLTNAAAACGFGLTDPFGPRQSTQSCSFSMRCSCGRDRTSSTEPKSYAKVLSSIVASTSTKQRKLRPGRFGGGYMRATTARNRSKFCSCDLEFNFTSEVQDEHGLLSWKFNTRRNCKNKTIHTGHPRTGFAIMSNDVTVIIRGLADNFTVPSILQLLRQQFKVPFTRSQIRYTCIRQNIPLVGHNSIAHSGVLGVAQTLNFLGRTRASGLLLLQKVDGENAGKMFQFSTKTGAIVRLSDYDGSKPVLAPDSSRIFTSVHPSYLGKKFFVWCVAWNWDTEAETFGMYPEVCIIDCMHGAANSTDGMNCIGVDGNLHNIGALRVFVFAQTMEVFRWVFCEAFPALVKNYKKIKVFFSDDDQHMGPVLKLLVGPGKLFPNASYLKCAWHLIRHNIEDIFGKGFGENPWQQRLISILSRVRKCETTEEFEACVVWMWRVVKGMEELGDVRSKLRLKVAAFITKRLDMKESWVMMYQLSLPTHGCSTTQRVESDHGTQRDSGEIPVARLRNTWDYLPYSA